MQILPKKTFSDPISTLVACIYPELHATFAKSQFQCNFTFSDLLPTVLSRMLLELHAFKVLFYAESVGVVTSGYVTKMAVTPFDPTLTKRN